MDIRRPRGFAGLARTVAAEYQQAVDRAAGNATAGNNRKVHLLKEQTADNFKTLCGTWVPRRPQTTQVQLPKCKRCFGGA
jgi:hypothetical protein